MRVLQVVPRYFPAIGGVETHVQRVSESLVEAGHTVEVVTLSHASDLPCVGAHNGVLVRRFPAYGPAPYYIPLALTRYLWAVRKEFDVVHAHSYGDLCLLSSLLVFPERCVVSLYYHGRGNAHSHLADAMHLAYDPIATRILRRAAHVVCLSKAEADRVTIDLSVPPGAVSVVPSGSSFTNVVPGPRDRDERLILSVSRLVRYKRVDRIIDALPHLPSDYHVVIAGDGPERTSLERLSHRLGVRDRVLFTGYVSDEQLQSWYQRAGVFMSMSAGETFGIAVLDALAMGCRVVCSNIPAYREFGDEYPTTVALADDTACGSALAALIESAAARASEATVDPARFSWRRTAAELVQVYRSAVGSCTPAYSSSCGIG